MSSRRPLVLSGSEGEEVSAILAGAFQSDPDVLSLRQRLNRLPRKLRAGLRQEIGELALDGISSPSQVADVMARLFSDEEGKVADAVFYTIAFGHLGLKHYTLHDLVGLYRKAHRQEKLRRQAEIIKRHLNRALRGRDRVDFFAITENVRIRTITVGVVQEINAAPPIDAAQEAETLRVRRDAAFEEFKAVIRNELPYTAEQSRLDFLDPEVRDLNAQAYRLEHELGQSGIQERRRQVLAEFLENWDSRWNALKEARQAGDRDTVLAIWRQLQEVERWLEVSRRLLHRDIELIRELVEVSAHIENLRQEKRDLGRSAAAVERIQNSLYLLDEVMRTNNQCRHYLAEAETPTPTDAFVGDREYFRFQTADLLAKIFDEEADGGGWKNGEPEMLRARAERLRHEATHNPTRRQS